jgi:hypothetical protein
MDVNYFNLHKSIINNRLNEEFPNYSLQSITCVSKLTPTNLLEYKPLTMLLFVAFEKYQWNLSITMLAQQYPQLHINQQLW